MHTISLNKLTLGYFDPIRKTTVPLFKPIAAQIEGGQAFVVEGPNGTGKTSLLRMLSGDAKGAETISGSIQYTVDGNTLTRCPTIKGYAVYAGLAAVDYISEHLDFLSARTILASGRTPSYYYAGAISSLMIARMDDLASEFKLSQYLDAEFSQLSSGQRMMLVIARAILARPQLLVLDEIDQYLAPEFIAIVKRALEQLRYENPNLIIVAAAHQKDRNTLYNDFNVLPLVPVRESQLRVEPVHHSELRYPLGTTVQMDIDSAFIRFGVDDPWQLNVPNWSIKGGQCWYLQGNNGAGKTTLLKAMAAKVPFHADSVRVVLNNNPLHFMLRHDAKLRAIYRGGFISEQRIEDVPELESTLDECIRGAEQGVHPIYAIDQPISERSREWLDLTKLTQYLDQPIKVLSSGQRKRFELVIAIASNAGVLLLDEPFNNLDTPSTELVVHAIDLLLDDGLAIVFTAHDVPDAITSLITDYARIRDGRLTVESA